MDSRPHFPNADPTRTRVVSRRLSWALGSIATLLAVGAVAAPTVFGGAPGSISVSASLAGCHHSGEEVTCRVAVSFSSLPGADHYTATVTRPDGSTEGFGRVGPGSATLPVTYTGNGEYVVTISAWASAKRLGSSASR